MGFLFMDNTYYILELFFMSDIIPLEVSYTNQIKIYALQSIVYIAKALYTLNVMVI